MSMKMMNMKMMNMKMMSDEMRINKTANSIKKRHSTSGKVNLITNKSKSLAEKTDRFTIQITSKKKLKDAQTFSKTLLKNGYDVYIQKISLR